MTNLTTHPSAKDNRGGGIETSPLEGSESLPAKPRPDTPSILRTAGIRLPHDQSAMDLNELEELLNVDLFGCSDTYIDDVADLLMGIFPDSKLPITPSRDLLERLTLYDSGQQKWKTPGISRAPKGSKIQSEVKLASFLNLISEDIGKITGHSPLRQWDSNFCNAALEGSPISRKPDIVLVDIARRTPTTWRSVRAITEVTTQEYETKKISNTVTDKTYVILTTQPNRVFVPILSIWGNFYFRLTVTDRQGQLRSQVINIAEPWRLHDSLNFLRLVIGFCYADKPVVGYDPTMLTDEWDRVTSIICDGKEFKVIKVIFETQSLVGRATRVWEVEFEGKRYILKDAWVEISRQVPEYTLLASLKGMEGVPQLFCGNDVYIGDVVLSTGLIRHGLWGNAMRVRVRRRVVSSSIGAHIASFRSKRELILAFRDVASSM